VRARIEEEALARFGRALDIGEFDASVEFRLAAPAGRTVR